MAIVSHLEFGSFNGILNKHVVVQHEGQEIKHDVKLSDITNLATNPLVLYVDPDMCKDICELLFITCVVM